MKIKPAITKQRSIENVLYILHKRILKLEL